jgi:hypothetical protein
MTAFFKILAGHILDSFNLNSTSNLITSSLCSSSS